MLAKFALNTHRMEEHISSTSGSRGNLLQPFGAGAGVSFLLLGESRQSARGVGGSSDKPRPRLAQAWPTSRVDRRRGGGKQMHPFPFGVLGYKGFTV